jgi:hypothetical protein
MTDQTPALNAALSKLQGELPTFTDDQQREVTVEHKDKTSHSYKYVTLNTIMEVVGPLMAKNGLSFAAMPGYNDPGDGKIVLSLRYRLAHSSGQEITGLFPLPGGDGSGTQGQRIQAMGSAISYARRYCLAAVLGIASEQDDDGKAAADLEAANGQAAATVRRTRATQARTEQAAANTERVRRRSAGEETAPAAAEPPRQRDPNLPVANGTLGHMFGLFNEIGYGKRDAASRAERMEITSSLVGRPLGSSNEMTSGEAQGLIEVLDACISAGDTVEERQVALQAALQAAAGEAGPAEGDAA